MYVDSHVHLSHRLYDGQFPCLTREQGEWRRLPEETREGLVEALREAGVTLCLEPGIDLASLDRLMALAERWPDFLLPAVGIHPTRAPGTPWRARHVLEALSQEKALAAIGELGLDYHLPRREQHRLRQKLWFCWQLSLAHRRELPLVLHIRQADGDAIRILRRYRGKLHGGVCHCFQGDAALARIYTRELGPWHRRGAAADAGALRRPGGGRAGDPAVLPPAGDGRPLREARPTGGDGLQSLAEDPEQRAHSAGGVGADRGAEGRPAPDSGGGHRCQRAPALLSGGRQRWSAIALRRGWSP